VQVVFYVLAHLVCLGDLLLASTRTLQLATLRPLDVCGGCAYNARLGLLAHHIVGMHQELFVFVAYVLRILVLWLHKAGGVGVWHPHLHVVYAGGVVGLLVFVAVFVIGDATACKVALRKDLLALIIVDYVDLVANY
jgi:hypothetical protein